MIEVKISEPREHDDAHERMDDDGAPARAPTDWRRSRLRALAARLERSMRANLLSAALGVA